MTNCFTLARGRRLRVTKLDDCGRAVFGDKSQGISKGFVSVSLTAQTQSSDEISVTDADGEIIVIEPEEESLSGYSAEIVFRQVDPELFSLITGQDPYLNSAGEAFGFRANTKKKAGRFSLEVWMGVQGTDVCDDPNAQGEYGYAVLPFLKGGIVGDITIENGAINFTITGARTRDGNYWGVGPHNVVLEGAVPSKLPNALDRNDHFLVIPTSYAPPAVVCGTRPLLDPTSEAVTSIAASVVGPTASFTPTPPDLAEPFWYEFGDGNYAYVPATELGVIDHTYTESGTYTVTATTNNTTVSTSVTVVVP